MANDLIVKPNTEIASLHENKDILSLYGVPAMLDKIVEKEKYNVLNKINCSTVIMDSINKIANSKDFYVEIPPELRKMLESGKAAFDKSSKTPGRFTPNIRIIGEKGIQGQAVIVEKADVQAITQSISNLTMMAMVQSVLEKLDVIEKKFEDVKQGQKNDRIGSVIGSFKAFMDLYPTSTSQEVKQRATHAYFRMQEGLGKLHLQIDEERKKLKNAPKNAKDAFIQSILHPFHNESERYQKCYEDYVYDLQLYNRLILLSDVVLHLIGDNEAIERNHKIIVKYCEEYIDSDFQNAMLYLMHGQISGIKNILDYNHNLSLALDGVLNNSLKIQCNQNDIKYLHNERNGSKEC